MDKEAAVQSLTDTMAKFTAYIGKRLPTDVKRKLADLRTLETNPLAKAIYDSMDKNQQAADKLDRPSCQDTGVIQYFISAGAKFPLLGELEEILQNATLGATKMGPLRHNAVETFDEKNTGTNTGSKIPWLDWEIVPDSDTATIDVYMAGGVGVSTSVETAARLSKRAILRPVDSRAANPNAAKMEELLEEGLNEIGIGPQGLTGNNSVMGVNIEASARHPSTIGVAVSTGCWAHRRGKIRFNSDLSYEILSHEGVAL